MKYTKAIEILEHYRDNILKPLRDGQDKSLVNHIKSYQKDIDELSDAITILKEKK